MSSGEIKNVLVVGTSGYETSRFIRTLGTYLKCGTHEEANNWKPNISEFSYFYDNAKDVTNTSMQIGNDKINFIYTSSMDNKEFYVLNQIIVILLQCLQKQKLTAIIFLVRPDTKKCDKAGHYKSCLFAGLKDFAERNILYVCNNDIDKTEETKKYMDTLQVEEKIFYFEESTFLNKSEDNWQQNVEFSNSIYNYIVGNDLQDYYLESVIPEKSVLNLADDLMVLLIQIYICANYADAVKLYRISTTREAQYRFYVDNYKKYVTTCYGCGTWIHKEERYVNNLKMKIPEKCHVPCKCTESDSDIGKCVIFESPDKKCSECNCNINLHSKKYFNITYQKRYNEVQSDEEKCIAIETLSTFFLYKRQNQQEYDIQKICQIILDMNDSDHKTISYNLLGEFIAAQSKLREKSNVITNENIIMCLKDLYKINYNATIMPRFIEEIFPKDFRLQTTTDEEFRSTKDVEDKNECNINNEKMEALRNENSEVKQLLQNANDLNSKLTQDIQNANDLNSKLIKDVQTLTERCRLNQNKDEPKEN